MRLRLRYLWLFALTLALQMGATPPAAPVEVLPQLIATRQATFSIPFRVEPSSDPAWQPVLAHLYVSTDHGLRWRLYTSTPIAEKHFVFRAGGDGEYWFAICTADRSGQVRPRTIQSPGLRVLVEAKTPGDSGPALTSPASEAVTVAAKPAIGRQYRGPSESASTIPGLPPGERPRMVNSRVFDLEYEVDSVGPSGIGRVDLWGTSDGGQSWRRFTTISGNHSPLRVSVPGEGMYGFRVVVTNGAGFGAKPPVAGDQPDLWIGVDLTKPIARIVSVQQGVEGESGQLIISWQADDKLLAARPISLSFSPSRGGPWTPIAAGLENSGRYAWPIDNRTPPTLFVRLEVRDEAGNVAVDETAKPVIVDQSHPTVRIRSVRPVGGGK